MQLIYADNESLNVWRQGDLTSAIPIFSQAAQGADHHRLANRAVVRARLNQWDLAEQDARTSIQVQPTILGRIAVSIALGGKGKLASAKQEFNQAFLCDEPKSNCLLLLIKSIIIFMAGEPDEATRRVTHLVEACEETDKPLCRVVQAQMRFLVGQTAFDGQAYQRALKSFASAGDLGPFLKLPELDTISLMFGWDFDSLLLVIRQRTCETLYAASQMTEAVQSLRTLLNEFGTEIKASAELSDWLQSFTRRCAEALQTAGDAAVANGKHDEAIMHYSMALSLDPPSRADLVIKRNKARLAVGAWDDAVKDLDEAGASRFTLYTQIGEALLGGGRVKEATDILRKLRSDLDEDRSVSGGKGDWFTEDTSIREERAAWEFGFRERCLENLEKLGDTAMDSKNCDEAVGCYSDALSLGPTNVGDILVKRSRALTTMGSWEDALTDADKVIELDSSSYRGYERRHAALHGAGRYDDAIGAFEMMLQKISQSPDSSIRERLHKYVDPGETTMAIRGAVQDAVRDLPRVLINTHSGRLLLKSEQASSFESQPAFRQLISSMTTYIDRARIGLEVAEYFRYATFSHTCEDNEPLFEKVVHIVVYDLEESPTHNKLQVFCMIVRDAGFNWAWSDCCINKGDHLVLQEALVAMFEWYEGSAMTIVFLRGVRSPSRRGDLARSLWNTRAWTLQEYHASKVVRFYTEDWTPYMNLNVPNHKESPEILLEMEEATGVSARALMTLRPGLDDIREKLCLASTRRTTLVEDAAYSLLGIFALSLPVIYGEGDGALGRLLAQLLTSSGDMSILAWTGRSGGFNSCLPAKIAVFSRLPTSHIPPSITSAEMETITARLSKALRDRASVRRLYDRLNELPVPCFMGKRMKLPSIVFKLGPLSASRSGSERVFRAQTTALGIVEIRTEEDLSRFDSLTLVHPWIDFLLDRQPVGSVFGTIPGENMDDQSLSIGELSSLPRPSNIPLAISRVRTGRLFPRFRLFGGQTATRPLDASSLRPETDRQMHALRVIARLRQPFGALLLTLDPGNVAAYRRVAAESLITVQAEEITPAILDKLISSVRVLDVL